MYGAIAVMVGISICLAWILLRGEMMKLTEYERTKITGEAVVASQAAADAAFVKVVLHAMLDAKTAANLAYETTYHSILGKYDEIAT